MIAIAERPVADRLLDWAARRPDLSSAAAAVVVGLSVWTVLQPVPAIASCTAPVVASVEAISPAALV